MRREAVADRAVTQSPIVDTPYAPFSSFAIPTTFSSSSSFRPELEEASARRVSTPTWARFAHGLSLHLGSSSSGQRHALPPLLHKADCPFATIYTTATRGAPIRT